jgi:4-oxalocrotonate tautomerase
MPFINIRTAKGLLDEAKKQQLAEKITDLMVEIEGNGNPAFKPFVWIMIEEQGPGDWCLGGTMVTEELIGQLKSG